MYNKGRSTTCKWIEKTHLPPVTTKEPSPSAKPINHSKNLPENFLESANSPIPCWLAPCPWDFSGSFLNNVNGPTDPKAFEAIPA